jgi:hypothetical protein
LDTGTGAARDVILDFQTGLDRIDLRGIDANTSTLADDAFLWSGKDPSAAATKNAIWFTHSNGNTIISGDYNGDGVPDFQIELIGVINPWPTDFYL